MNENLVRTQIVTDFPSSGEERCPTGGVVAADRQCKRLPYHLPLRVLTPSVLPRFRGSATSPEEEKSVTFV